ncbi:hypothetical protein EHQ53_13945, partial [Leptospira langatensis]
MSFPTRTQVQNANIIQDADEITTNLDNEGDPLSATQVGTNTSLAKLAQYCWGIAKMFGEKNRRHGATKVNGSDISLTGTISATGTAVIGSGTSFTTELAVGDWICGTAGQFREVASITDNLNLVLVSGFSSNFSGQAYKRMKFLAERLDSFNPGYPGIIIGGLAYQASSSPPTVRAGIYDIAGATVQKSSDYNTSVNDAFLNSKQGLDTTSNYYVVMDSSGNVKYMLSTGSVLQATQAVTGLTGTTTKTVTVGTIGSIVNGGVAVFTGAGNSILGIYKIFGLSGSTFQITTTDTTNVFATLQVTVYNNVTSLATASSYLAGGTGCNLVSPNSTYNPTKNGYYVDATGISGAAATSYRILGTFSTDGTPNIYEIPGYGYRNGKNRNDNYWEYGTMTGLASTATKSPYYTNVRKAYGNDYVVTNDSTNGFKVTTSISAKMKMSSTHAYTARSLGAAVQILINDPGTTAYTATAEPTLKSSATFNSGTGLSGTATAYYEGYLKPNDYLRVIVRD